MAIKVTVIDKSPNEVMDIVKELRGQGMVQGEDFDFAYFQPKYDINSYDAVENRKAIFTFYTEKYATLFTLKYGT